MTERGAQHGEILGNALRLYSDAKLLFENGRFASCASLPVLAIEELAKFMGMIGPQPLPVLSWRSHPDKHVGSASFLLRKRYQAALREVLEEMGAADPDADYRRLADMECRDDEMALFDAVLARIVSDGSLDRFSRAHLEETDPSSSGSTSASTTRCGSGQRHRRSLPSWRRIISISLATCSRRCARSRSSERRRKDAAP
jgi:hypothetical protein